MFCHTIPRLAMIEVHVHVLFNIPAISWQQHSTSPVSTFKDVQQWVADQCKPPLTQHKPYAYLHLCMNKIFMHLGNHVAIKHSEWVHNPKMNDYAGFWIKTLGLGRWRILELDLLLPSRKWAKVLHNFVLLSPLFLGHRRGFICLQTGNY